MTSSSIISATDVTYHRKERMLEVSFDNGVVKRFSAAFLRQQSPSADIRGHGTAPRKPVPGSEHAEIQALEPVGHYAVRIIFQDGHHTGLYSWRLLWELPEQT